MDLSQSMMKMALLYTLARTSPERKALMSRNGKCGPFSFALARTPEKKSSDAHFFLGGRVVFQKKVFGFFLNPITRLRYQMRFRSTSALPKRKPLSTEKLCTVL